MRWADFEAAAPELAERGRERFEATHVALLGTVRADGSARISPIEPYLAAGELLFGIMRSSKSGDLTRDQRVMLHSSVSRPDGSEGEFKLTGVVVPVVDEQLRSAPARAWWQPFPAEMGTVYAVDIRSAAYVSWNLERSTFDITSWTAGRGINKRSARYP